jgi:hypothetical protein
VIENVLLIPLALRPASHFESDFKLVLPLKEAVQSRVCASVTSAKTEPVGYTRSAGEKVAVSICLMCGLPSELMCLLT